MTMTDLDYMKEALRLAAEGRGQVSPNPLVGAVVVKEGRIIGRGLHRYAELKHAEVNALEEADEEARGATLYLNLEPCCHHGRTPPCTDAVLRSGVSRVVAAMADPNPQVAGHGFEILRSAGIEIDVGLCEREARRLNEKFIKFITSGRPFVHLKVAMTLDGKIATRSGRSRWITGEVSRERSHMLRSEYDAILVGVGTVITDDPELTARPSMKEDEKKDQRHRPLLRVVLDGRLRTPLDSRLLAAREAGPVLIFADEESAVAEQDDRTVFQNRLSEYKRLGAEVIFSSSAMGRVSLELLLDELGSRKASSLIVEGGSDVSGQFLNSRLIDKVTFFIAPKLIGGRQAVPAIGGEGFETLEQAIELEEVSVAGSGRDIEITGYPKKI
jgi:diaminohydroxyphosphoribosylaminopyrimidine deaminase / 5-amino-6-(5-phosphoribosylamino)uracil reductase